MAKPSPRHRLIPETMDRMIAADPAHRNHGRSFGHLCGRMALAIAITLDRLADGESPVVVRHAARSV